MHLIQDSKFVRIRLVSSFLLLFFSPVLLICQEDHSLHKMQKIADLRFTSEHPDSLLFGSWESVIPKPGGGAVGKSLGMQTVHTILLPSGKILMASGSSWRNLAPLEYYPQFEDPIAGTGLFDRRDDPFHERKLPEYYQLVNNAAIYDPEDTTFYRIPAPYPMLDSEEADHFIPNDFFCTGHLHLPDGNPFFIGGTQYYYPYRTGARTSYIFDWRKELTTEWQSVDWRQKPNKENDPWIFSGLMKRGRWYPTLVPLLDGRFAIFSGFVGFDRGFPAMYQFELNHYVEFFDPHVFEPIQPQKAWKAIDVKDLANSPFSTKLGYELSDSLLNICYDRLYFPGLRLDPTDKNFVEPCNCPLRCVEAYKYDAFKLYPHNYLFDGNKIYLSREGEWVSLRSPNTEFMRKTKFTYWMDVEGTAESPEVTFRRGPNRPDTITSYGTSYLDPNSGNLTILGGQPTSPGTLLPLGSENPNHFAGGRGSRKIEQFQLNANGGEGSWTLEEDFLGEYPQDDRTMHFAIILPTRQILIINGGNYDFYGPVLYPILLTPQFDEAGKFLGYEKQRMVDAVEPRLYHNSAMLLPDGRIFVSGGNSARATVRTEPIPPADSNRYGQPLPNFDLVELDVYFLTDGKMAKQAKGSEITPTENWTAELFSPPYLFIDGKRRTKILNLSTKPSRGTTFSNTIGEKTFYLLHSNRGYTIELSGLPDRPFTKGHALVLLKLPSVTHGGQWGQHFIELPITKASGTTLQFQTPDAKAESIPPGFYMLFYVDRMGKPSVAQMVRFDDEATTP